MALDTSRKESETREAESEKTNRKISLEEHQLRISSMKNYNCKAVS